MWADVLFLNIWLPRPELERGWPPSAPPHGPRTARPPPCRGAALPPRAASPARALHCIVLRCIASRCVALPHGAEVRRAGEGGPRSSVRRRSSARRPSPPASRWYDPGGGAPGSPHVISPPCRRRRFQAGPGGVAALRGGSAALWGRPRTAEGPSAGRACPRWRRLHLASSRPGEPRRARRGRPAPFSPGFP